LTVSYSSATATADQLTIDVTVGDDHQSYVRARTPGLAQDTIEIDFRLYSRAAPVVVAVTVSRAGTPLGAGQAQSTLAASCTTMAMEVSNDGPNGGDAGSLADDLSAQGPPADLAATAPADLAGAAKSDLAATAPADLATTAYDLATTAPPDLATIPDLAMVPPVVTFSGESDTAQYPSGTANPAYVDACPPGQAMIGFNLAVQSDTSGNQVGINRADTLCAVPAVKPAVGGGWTVVWVNGAVLSGHGTADQAGVKYQCKTDTFLVGFGGRSGLYLDQLLLSCAPIVVADNGSVSVGATTSSNTGVGGTGGSAFANVYCPAGQIATMLRTRDQAGAPPDAFGFGCSTPKAVH
jgi:hypothetical protein